MANRAATAVALILAGVSISGCTHIKSKHAGYIGNEPDLSVENVTAFRKDQDTIVKEFATLGGLKELPAHGGDWRPVVDGGMLYVDVRCDRFMDALFWLNRVRETTSNQIQYAGSATSAILAIANASKELIGIAPLGFGFADETVNNIGQGLLYHLEPGAVAKLVTRKQGTYRDAIKNVAYTNRSAALTTVQQYAANCLPVSIEGEVTQAIANSEFERVDYRAKKPAEPQPQPADQPQPDEPGVAEDQDPAPPPPPPPPPGSIPPPEQNLVPNIEQTRPH